MIIIARDNTFDDNDLIIDDIATKLFIVLFVFRWTFYFVKHRIKV